MMDLGLNLLDKIINFYEKPTLVNGFSILFILGIAGVLFWRYLNREQIELNKQKNEILLSLIANGFTETGIKHLKETLRLCKDNKPKKFHDYVVLNKKWLSFFLKYPKIYKDVAEGNKVFANKDLKESKDIFGDLWWLGINTHDLINDSVLNHLDTALLMTDEGTDDLKKVNFYFDELSAKANVIEQRLEKLEKNLDYKRIIKKKKIFQQ
jgi:hypothetical protein